MTTPLPWGNEFSVYSIRQGDNIFPQITALANGRFVAVWGNDYTATRQDTHKSAVMGQVFNADGSLYGSHFLVNTTTAESQTEPSITALADGHFVVAWSDNSLRPDGGRTNVRGQVFDVDGNKVDDDKSDSEFLITTPTSRDQFAPTLAALPDGRFVAAWHQRRADFSGTDVRVQIRNADGSGSGEEFSVNTTPSDGDPPSISVLSNGRFAVVWGVQGNEHDIRSQVFDLKGNKIGPETLVNTTTANSQAHHKATALSDGRFVVVWTDNSNSGGDTSGGAIRGQIFNMDGSKDGGEFLVNTATAGNQYRPTVTALPDGRFAVAWVDDSKGTSETDVRAQVFNADGSKSGSEFLVTAKAGIQKEPTITGLADGRLVVSWSDDGDRNDTSPYEIRGQIFDPRIAAVSLEGTARNDDYLGSTFADTLKGGTGRDNLKGEAGDDVIDGGADDDKVFGGLDNDTLRGGSGNDTLTGGEGDDRHEGGAGDDVYYVDDALDRVVENAAEGRDTVQTSVSFALDAAAEVETLRFIDLADTAALNLTGSNTNNALVGNAGANILRGEGGADTLDGAGGADTLIGGSGNDTYMVDSLNVTVVETSSLAGEKDTVWASLSYTLGENIEYLMLSGSDDLVGTGNGLANWLIGNAGGNALNGLGGDDTLIGGTGQDTLAGGSGNDTYEVEAGDIIVETSTLATEIDLVESEISWILGANLDNLTLTGVGASSGTGNALNNTLTGNGAANRLDGGAGADALSGGAGRDWLIGGAGQDRLTGGVDSDTFAFAKRTSGVTTKSVDTVLDWSVKDQIDMTVKGSKRNYLEGSTKATSITSALKAAETLDAKDKAAYVYLYNKKAKTGFLLADLDGNHRFETGVILKGASAASHFSYSDII